MPVAKKGQALFCVDLASTLAKRRTAFGSYQTHFGTRQVTSMSAQKINRKSLRITGNIGEIVPPRSFYVHVEALCSI